MKIHHQLQIMKKVNELCKDFVLSDDFMELICNLTDLHSKYEKELNMFNVYHRHELDKARLIYHEMAKLAKKDNNIRISFTRNKTLEFKKGIFAYYFYDVNGENVNITDLIVFNNKKHNTDLAQFHTLTEDIKNWNFDENEQTPI